MHIDRVNFAALIAQTIFKPFNQMHKQNLYSPMVYIINDFLSKQCLEDKKKLTNYGYLLCLSITIPGAGSW